MPRRSPSNAEPDITVRALLDAYARDYRLYHRSARSLEGLALFVRAFGDWPLAALDAQAVDAWRRDRRRQGIRPVTINRNVAALGGALTYAVEAGYLTAHPLRGLRPLPVDDDPRVRYLSADEERRLRRALAARDDHARAARNAANEWRRARGDPPSSELEPHLFADYLTPAVLITLNTGLRRGELLALQWADAHGHHLTVRAATSKSRRTRHVPLNHEAQAVLTLWRGQQLFSAHASQRASKYVLASARGRPLASIRKAWHGVLREAGIGDFRWHDLRHHFASKLVMAGVPLNTVRELLGHADLKMTLRYAHLAHSHLQHAVDALAEAKQGKQDNEDEEEEGETSGGGGRDGARDG